MLQVIVNISGLSSQLTSISVPCKTGNFVVVFRVSNGNFVQTEKSYISVNRLEPLNLLTKLK